MLTCDLAVEGSPSISMLRSPRRWVPLERFFSDPPSSIRSSAIFSWSWPQIEGARLRAIWWRGVEGVEGVEGGWSGGVE